MFDATILVPCASVLNLLALRTRLRVESAVLAEIYDEPGPKSRDAARSASNANQGCK